MTPVSFALRQQSTQVELTYAPLAEGTYQFVIHAANVTDRVGNALGAADSVTTFRIAAVVREPTIRWVNPAGGFWDDPANWQDSRLPGRDDDILIDMPGDPGIIFRQDDVLIRSLVSENPLTITGGRLFASETIQVNDTFTLRGADSQNIATLGGTVLRGSGGQGLTVAGHSRLESATVQADITLSEAGTRLRISGGLTQIGTTTLIYNTAIGFEGSQEVTSGTFVFNGSVGAPPFGGLFFLPGLEAIGPNVTLTLGKDVLVHGGIGAIAQNKFFSGTLSVINRGTIRADVDDHFGLVTQTSSFTNEGTIGTTGGGNFNFNDDTLTNAATGKIVADGGGFQHGINIDSPTWSNAGLISARDCVVTFFGHWSSTGSMISQDAIMTFRGQFTGADVQNVQRSGGSIRISGLMDNTGQSFTFNSLTGSYDLLGGTIRGGTLNMGGPTARLEMISGQLDGVTLNGDLELGSRAINTQVSVTNGLILNGTVKFLDSSFNKFVFQGDQIVPSGTFVVEHPAGASQISIGVGLEVASGSTVTLGANVIINSNSIGAFIAGKFISYATITAQSEGGVVLAGNLLLNAVVVDEFINRGMVHVNPNASLALRGVVNEGTITVDRADRLVLGPTWHNRGLIDVTNSLVIISGAYSSTADISDYRNPTGQTSLRGLLDNSGSTLVIDGTTGRWDLTDLGTFSGGTVRITSGGSLISNQGRFHDVTVQGNFTAYTLNVVGDVTITDTVTMSNFFDRLNLGDEGDFSAQPAILHAGTFDFSGRDIKFIQGFIPFSGPVVPVTFGPGVVMRGRHVSATLPNPLLNQGSIIADFLPQFIGDDANNFDFTTAPVTNEGLFEATHGGLLTISNLVTNRGTLAARAGSIVSMGGNLPQEATGTVTVDIAGRTTTEFGRITVAGAANLAGTLNVNFTAGFAPASGDAFQVMTYASFNGSFSTLNVTGLPAGLAATAVYNPSSLSILVGMALSASGSPISQQSEVSPLTTEQVRALLDAALTLWTAAGIDAENVGRFRDAQWQIADLGSNLLGLTAGNVITLDDDAAGRGWFVDPTPLENEEFAPSNVDRLFTALADGPAAGRVDLFTAMLHELGHVLGLEHCHDLDTDDLMYEELALSDRRLPTAYVDRFFVEW